MEVGGDDDDEGAADEQQEEKQRRRRRRKKFRRPDDAGSSLESETLMKNGVDKAGDDSDIDQSVNRLCQYLTNSEDDDVESGELSHHHKRPLSSTVASKSATGVLDNKRNSSCEAGQMMDFVVGASGNSFARKRPPPDFLNIPPPAHAPDESPVSDRRPPLPPNRTLPPVPRDEPQYEEAKPPPPAPRPSKQVRRENSYHQRPQHMMNNNNLNSVPDYMNEQKPLYVSQGSQYNNVDWHNYNSSILERNETGSFYIPSSGHTTMSTISPSRKSELEQQNNRHNYSLLPLAQTTTVPVPMLPMKQQQTSPRKRKTSSAICTWKCLTFTLAAGLIFALAVICYLLVNLFTSASSATERPPLISDESSRSILSTDSAIVTTSLRPLPENFDIGDHIVVDLPPGQLRHTSFNVQRNSYVQFNMSVEQHAKLAVYGRQTLAPSPTEHDFAQIILGAKLHASPSKRWAQHKPHGYHYPDQNLRSTTFVHYLLEGRWHLAFLNDDTSTNVVRFSTYLTDEEPKDCKYNCYEKGICENGKCSCFQGYSGAYCEETVCPVLCSGNGIFTNGKCHCHQGWKGVDCNVPSNVCEILNCNRNGQCNANGECVCDRGFKGRFCDEHDCPNTNCSNHGACVDGKCFCDFGWRGDACDVAYTSGELCPERQTSTSEECSNRGMFDSNAKACSCEFGFTGERCEKTVCNLDCGAHGRCENNLCMCDEGWTGLKCSILDCRRGCEEHGACHNGTCVCRQGWNGDNCLLDGCPNSCSSHGKCENFDSEWKCVCDTMYIGLDCSIPLELQCSDKIDNDGDRLTDCEDSECCSSPACRDSTTCQTVPDPHQVLMKMQAPPPQSSFFQKTRFLLNADSLQHYADVNLFNESRAAVVRGRTVNVRGGPLMGVRVTDTSNALYGFTLSRVGGWFDLMINGGSSATLQFMRLPFGSIFKTVRVPWNEIVFIGDVVMTTKDEMASEEERDSSFSVKECGAAEKLHDIRPYLVPSWKFTSLGASTGHSGVVADAEAVQEFVRVLGTDVYLIYFSSNSGGHQSTLKMFLAPSKLPSTLRLIKIVVDVEGVHFEKLLEAAPNLTYTFGWDMRNVYKQKVFGLTLATVSVGYFYANCPKGVWERQKVKLSGHRSSISDLGGWNLNIHNKYDVLNGVVEKGDGSAIYLKEQPPLLLTSLSEKNGLTNFVPIAVAVAKDGGLYVGDQSSIRYLSPINAVSIVVQLSGADTSHQYFMAVHPLSGDLYVSLALRRQIWRIRSNATKVSSSNYEIVVGTGESCAFDDDCGDGGSSESAKLNFPKGIAFDSQGNLFVADERKIRKVSTDGLMSTLIGESKKNVVEWRPLECRTEFAADSLRLQWPTSLTTNIINDNIIFLDGDTIFEILSENRIRVVVGAATNCATLTTPSNISFRSIPLKNAVAIASTLDGKLLIAETDGRRSHRIRSYDEHRRSIDFLVGTESNCDCSKNCPCDDVVDVVLARNARLNRPMSLAVDHRNYVHIVDQGNSKIRTVRPSEPEFDSHHRIYRVFSPDSQELFMFNRHGQHVSTKNLISDRFVYNFTYHVDSSYGTLVQVAAAGGARQLLIGRKDRFKISLENADGLKSTVFVSRFHQMMEKFVDADGAVVQFSYGTSNDLLINKIQSDGGVWFYDYDAFGHLHSVMTPVGDAYRLKNLIVDNRVESYLFKNGELSHKFTINENEIDVESGSVTKSIFRQEGGVFYLNTDDGASVQYDSGTHSLLEAYQSSILRRKLSLPSAPELGRKELTSTLEWRYHLKRVGRENRKRVAQINGVNLLNIEYDRDTNKDLLYNQNNVKILELQYNVFGDVVHWQPTSPTVASMNITYDTLGRPVSLQWGSLSEKHVYDLLGRLVELKSFDIPPQKSRKFSYGGDRTKPTTVYLPSGLKYQLFYDERGDLSRIITPSTRQQYFYKYRAASSINFVYAKRNDEDFFVLSKNFDGTLASFRYPSGERLVTFEYIDQKLSDIFHDDVHISYVYDRNDKSAPSEISVESFATKLKKWNSYQGHLLAYCSEQRSFDQNAHRIDVNFAYQYDDHLRLSIVRSTFDGVSLQPLELEYEPSTGRLIRMSEYRYDYSEGKIRFFNDRSSSETILSSTGSVVLTKMVVQNRAICEQRLHYDTQARLKSTSHLIGSEDYAASYEYDDDGRLASAKIKRNNEVWWQYEYDADGNVKRVNNLTATYDDDGWRMRKFGHVTYGVNKDGFVTKRGDVTFEYDSHGRLKRAHRKSPDEIDNRYLYDESSRLTSLKRLNKWHHFWYARPDKPSLITHMLESDTGVVTVFLYDHLDRLHALEKSGTYIFVVSTPDLTPQFLFTNDGSFLTWIYRSPFGETVQSTTMTTDEFYLPVGFKGQFQDVDCNVVIFADGGRPYDAVSGRWMSVRVDKLFDEMNLIKPELIVNHHVFNNNDPVNVAVNVPRSFEQWAMLVGYDFSNFVPMLILSKAPMFNCQEDNIVTLASECVLKKKVEKFHSFESVQRSALSYSSSSKRVTSSLAKFDSVFGAGVVASNVSNKMNLRHVDSSSDSDASSKNAIFALLNGSQLVPVKFALNGKTMEFFWKPNGAKALNADLAKLGVKNAALTSYVPSGVNWTISEAADNEKDVQMWNRFTSVHLHYGGELSAETERILRFVLSRLEATLWASEYAAAIDGRPTKFDWTAAETSELLSKGKVNAYQAQYVKDPLNVYSILVADPNNLSEDDILDVELGPDDLDDLDEDALLGSLSPPIKFQEKVQVPVTSTNASDFSPTTTAPESICSTSLEKDDTEDDESDDDEEKRSRGHDRFTCEQPSTTTKRTKPVDWSAIPESLDDVKVVDNGSGNNDSSSQRNKRFNNSMNARRNNNNRRGGGKVLLNPHFKGNVTPNPTVHTPWILNRSHPLLNQKQQSSICQILQQQPRYPSSTSAFGLQIGIDMQRMPIASPMFRVPPPLVSGLPLHRPMISGSPMNMLYPPPIVSQPPPRMTPPSSMNAPPPTNLSRPPPPLFRPSVPPPQTNPNTRNVKSMYDPSRPPPLFPKRNDDDELKNSWLGATEDFLRKLQSDNFGNNNKVKPSRERQAAASIRRKYGIRNSDRSKTSAEPPRVFTKRNRSSDGYSQAYQETRPTSSSAIAVPVDDEYLRKVEEQKRLREELNRRKELRRQKEIAEKQERTKRSSENEIVEEDKKVPVATSVTPSKKIKLTSNSTKIEPSATSRKTEASSTTTTQAIVKPHVSTRVVLPPHKKDTKNVPSKKLLVVDASSSKSKPQTAATVSNERQAKIVSLRSSAPVARMSSVQTVKFHSSRASDVAVVKR